MPYEYEGRPALTLINFINIMSFNSFDYYQQLRQYQLHLQKLSNPETKVQRHEAFKPLKPQYQKAREYVRNKQIQQIEHQNTHMMQKLVKINRRQPSISQSSPSLTLPKIKRDFSIPSYQQQNNLIAKKIIQSKTRIGSIKEPSRYHSIEARRSNISKYHQQDGVVINRKKYIAELMLLKKMRMSEVIRNKQ